eukprot:SAG11_NODE_639_length_8017_cov_4.086259_2_plen_163_part_00
MLSKVKKTSGPQPSIKIDRRKARWSAGQPSNDSSIFCQIFYALGKHAKQNDIFRGNDHWWEVDFEGEHLSDAGGGFRETISNISDDLNSGRTHLFIKTPNHVNEVGDLRDAWMPSPGCEDFPKFVSVQRDCLLCIYSGNHRAKGTHVSLAGVCCECRNSSGG